ncbi:MAG: recombination regulator RecX [Burkholderiaceae bacterium]
MPLPPPSLKGRALRLLAMREYSVSELERRLKRHEVEPGQLRTVLDELQAKGFIDNRRVIASVIHQRAAKLGLARIRQELQHKGVAGEEAREALAALQPTELARAHQIWRKKFGNAATEGSDGAADAPTDAAHRARQMRFLAARGFTGDTIRRVVSGAHEMLDDDTPPD